MSGGSFVAVIALLLTVAFAPGAFAQGLTDSANRPPPTGATNPYSPPGTFLPGQPGFPAVGQSYVDPVFGSTVRRITNDFAQQSFSDIYAMNGWWNADASLFFHRRASSWVIVDTTTGAVVRSGVPGGNGFIEFDPVNPDVYYYLTGAQLRSYSVSANTNSLVKTFPATLGGLGGSVDWIDRTGRYFLVTYSGALRIWDKQTDTIYAGAVTANLGAGWAGISPDAKYVITTDNNFRSFPINHTTQTLSTTGTLFWTLCGDHGDIISASDGKTYVVTFNCNDEPGVWRVDVSLPQTAGNVAQQKSQNRRLFVTDWDDTGHFSCAATGPNRDWCFVSVESVDDTFGNQGAWRAYKSEIVMAQVVAPFTVRRLAHHRSRSIGADYYYMPRVSASWDGSMVGWASNMGYQSGVGYSDIYVIDLAVNNPVPSINSLSPTSTGAGGAAFTLTATGTGFVSGSVVQWSGANRPTTVVSSTQLQASITVADVATAGTAAVRVVSPAPGGGTSSTQTFTISIPTNPSPTLASISPSSAGAGGSAFTLTATGTNFVNGSQVRWNGVARTTTFVSATQLTATITAADLATAGTSPVTVFTPAPGGGTSVSRTFTINNPAPGLTTLAPSNAAVGSAGFTLTLTGSGFVAASGVRWNGAARTTTFVSATQLTATIAAADIATPGTASVTVVNPTPGGGTSSALTFTIGAANNPVPTLASISPSSAGAGGSAFTLTATGTNFVNGSQVRWNGAARTTTFVSATQLTATITAADLATAGTSPVTVFTPAPGGGTSVSRTFTVNNPAPGLTTLSPNNTVAGSGSFTLTLTGSNFVATSSVRWNGGARTTTFVSATQLTATIAAADIATLGTASVTVVNPTPGGGTSGASTFTITVPAPAPTLTSLSPKNRIVGGAGFTLTVNGTGFVSTSTVRWNGANRPTTFVSATRLTATIAAADVATAAVVSVTVMTPGGGTSAAETFKVRNPVPGLTALAPSSAPAGTAPLTLTVTGTDFVAASKVRWNGANRPTTFVSATRLTAAITAVDLATAGTVSVTVRNPTPGGGTSAARTFTITPATPSP